MENKPLNAAFNVAVKQMASRACPNGYDVADDAPDTFEALKSHYVNTGRMLVWNGASDKTIFACPETNYAFRAWHDLCHVRGDFPFTLEGEKRAARMQMHQLIKVYGDTPEAHVFCDLIACEVIGQAEYFERTGEYPVDQLAFTVAYLEARGLDHVCPASS